MTLPASRLAPLNTSHTALHSVRADSDCSSSADESPETPCSTMTLSGSPPRLSKLSPISSSAVFNRSSLSCSSSSCSEDESQGSDVRDASPDESELEPVFTSLPTRRVQSSGALARGPGSGLGFTSTSGSSSPVSPSFQRRTPSFPVSRPIRPFDSISNAMGTCPKRVSPPSEAPFTAAKTLENAPRATSDKAAAPTTQLDDKPKPWRSNKLLEPPKNNRFQNGFFILDMTQDEFKRAW